MAGPRDQGTAPRALYATVHCDRRKWLLVPTEWDGRFSDPEEWADTVAARCWEAWLARNPAAEAPGTRAVERTALLLRSYAGRSGRSDSGQRAQLTYLYLPNPAENAFLMRVNVDDTSGLTVEKAMAEPDMRDVSAVEFGTDALGTGRKFSLKGTLDPRPDDPPGPPGEWLSIHYIFDVPGRKAMVTVSATDTDPAHISAADEDLDAFVRGITVSADPAPDEAWDPHPGRTFPLTTRISADETGSYRAPQAPPDSPSGRASSRAARVAVAVGVAALVMIVVGVFTFRGSDDASDSAGSSSPIPPQRHATLSYLAAASWKPQVDIQDTDYPGGDLLYPLHQAGVATEAFGPGWRLDIDSAPATPSSHLSDMFAHLEVVRIEPTPCTKVIDIASQPPDRASGPTPVVGLPSGWRGIRSTRFLQPEITLAGCRSGTLVYGWIAVLASGLTLDEVDAAADRLAAAIAHRGLPQFFADTAPATTAAPGRKS